MSIFRTAKAAYMKAPTAGSWLDPWKVSRRQEETTRGTKEETVFRKPERLRVGPTRERMKRTATWCGC